MRTDCARNIVLIGMPGAGKSTVGVLLAKRLGYHFIDTDLLIQAGAQARLQQIIAARGMAAFKMIEAEVLCRLSASRAVVATGGSAVYSKEAMHHLADLGRMVFIDVPLADLQNRIEDMDSRGLVLDADEDFPGLFARRRPLYRSWADITIDAAGLTPGAVAATIEDRVCG
ncbi:MAG: shikimate kinase [Desulfuromonadales bacterium]|nr:shikimate kinase [Desulfuromonadales bacterium]